jgi:hypothetical protein
MPLDSKPDGAIALVNAIKNHGELTIVNLLSNNIRPRQARELIKLMDSKDKLTTLCGFTNLGIIPLLFEYLASAITNNKVRYRYCYKS